MISVKKVKTAIVGCGMISSIYIKNLANLFEITDVVALCDHYPERAEQQQKLFGVGKVMRYEETIADPEIEMIVNLTSPAQHYEVIKSALNANKNVFTEKILCVDLEQGKELVELAKERKLYLGVAPDTFLGAGLQTARFMIDHGMIGRVTSCIAAINRNHRYNSELFGYIRFPGGAFPFDIGVYFVSAILSLLGPVTNVIGFTTSTSSTYQAIGVKSGMLGNEWKLEGHNILVGSLQFASGVLGSLHFNGESIGEQAPHITIYGTEGILSLGDPNTFNGYVKLMRHGAESPVEMPFTHGYCGTPVYGPEGRYDLYQHRGIGAAEMAWSMRKNRVSRANKELGLHTMEVLCGIDNSSSTKSVYNMTTRFDLPAPLPSGHMLSEHEDGEVALTV